MNGARILMKLLSRWPEIHNYTVAFAKATTKETLPASNGENSFKRKLDTCIYVHTQVQALVQHGPEPLYTVYTCMPIVHNTWNKRD